MKYQLVIFDFDGTLADSYPWFLSVFQGLAQRYRLPRMDSTDLEKLRGFDVRQILKEYHIPLWKGMLIGNHLKRLMSSQIDEIHLVNGMQCVIERLGEAGVKMAVVTSNAEKNVRHVLGPGSLAHFDWIESGVSLFGKKKKFEQILRKSGIPAGQALSIGDEVRDLHSARAANIPFGAVTWGYTDRQILQAHAPEAVFEHPEQILEAVEGLRPSPAVPTSDAG